MNDYNFFNPKVSNNNKNIINLTFGLSGPPDKTAVNNLPKLWLQATKKLQKGDLLVCSGDFVQACIDCCFGKEIQKNGKKYYIPDTDSLNFYAKKFNTEPCGFLCASNLYNNIPSYKDIQCKSDSTENNCQQCMRPNNNENTIPGTCLSGCYIKDPDASKSYDLNLLEELKAALLRGAYVCFVLSGLFNVNIFPSNKVQQDYVNYILQDTSPNFYWFNIPPPKDSNTNVNLIDINLLPNIIEATNPIMEIHSKVCTAFYWGEDTINKSVFSCLGSYNPSFPNSLELETAFCVSSSIYNIPKLKVVNTVTEQISLFTYAFISNMNANHVGGYNNVSWDNQFRNIENMFLNNYPNWKVNLPPINKNGISTTINFCGKLFCDIENDNYDPLLEDNNYVNFIEENVLFYLGAEGFVPNNIEKFGTKQNAYQNILPWGMDLMNNIINDTKKYLKFSYYGNILDCNNITKKCGYNNWLIGDSINNIINSKSSEKPIIYVIQKPTKSIGMVCPVPPTSPDPIKCAIENIPENLLPLTKLAGPNFYYKFYNQLQPNKLNIDLSLHSKFMMSENALFMSTQHPIPYFYGDGTNDINNNLSSHGYDVVLKNCPNIIEYYNNFYNYLWDKKSYETLAEIKRLNNQGILSVPKLSGKDCTIESKNCCKLGINNIKIDKRNVSCEPILNSGKDCIKENGEWCGEECIDVEQCLSNPNCDYDFESAQSGSNKNPCCYRSIKNLTPNPIQTTPTTSTTYKPLQLSQNKNRKKFIISIVILIILLLGIGIYFGIKLKF